VYTSLYIGEVAILATEKERLKPKPSTGCITLVPHNVSQHPQNLMNKISFSLNKRDSKKKFMLLKIKCKNWYGL
jgi:hypothetical protein